MASQVVKCRDGPGPQHPSIAFQLKCERELEKLRGRFKKQLQNDMLNLFEEKTFADLTLISEDQRRISAHSSLLKVRAPRFYNHCLATADKCITQPNWIVELPGLKGTQLHKFIRTVYCGEETEPEETSLLERLLSRKRTPMDSCEALDGRNSEKEGNCEEITGSQKSETGESDNHRLAYVPRPIDNEANYETEEYGSFSDGINCNGTLADLTDPFSASMSDAMNVSTLNANEDASLLSGAEELAGSEELLQFEGEDEECEADHHKLNLGEKGGFSVLSSEVEADLMEAAEPEGVEENRGSESDDRQGSHFEMNVSSRGGEEEEEKEAEEEVVKSFVDHHEKLPLGMHTVIRMTADESHLMIRSNESKDGDSGVCCSVSRKLSTSSSCGRHSPCFSEHLQDSPTGSLPKDDSLEFCPDSLTSDDVPHVIEALVNAEWTMNAAYQLDKRRVVDDRQGASKRQAWSDEGAEQRRWSTSCLESQPKSILKPSAVVPPYNADVDAEATARGSAGKGSDASFSVHHPSSQVAQWTNASITQIQHRSVQLDFVPFLEEWTIGQGPKPPHPAAEQEILDGKGLDATFTLTAVVSEADGSAADGFTVLADAGCGGHEAGKLAEEPDIVEISDVTNQPAITGDSGHLGLDTVMAKTQIGTKSGLNSKEEVHLFQELDICNIWNATDQPAITGVSEGLALVTAMAEKQIWTKPGLNSKEEGHLFQEPIIGNVLDDTYQPGITSVSGQFGLDTVMAKNQIGTIESGLESKVQFPQEPGFGNILDATNQPAITGVSEALGVGTVMFVNQVGTVESVSAKEEVQVSERDLPKGELDQMPVATTVPELSSGNGESQAQKPEGYFVFIDVGDLKASTGQSSSEECTGNDDPQSPTKKSTEAFFFIPTDDASATEEKKTEEPPQLPVAEERPAVAHQPVYMYIEASSPASSTNSGHSSRLFRPGERKGPVLRRRGGAPAQRPKSESAATLLVDASKMLVQEKASKRASMTFGDDEEATYSVETASKEVSEEVKVPPPAKWCSKLGRDLLRMFLDEIDPDVVIRVGGKDIKAHKSILTSRCVYFAAMLSGGWVESAGNVIKMQGFSYDAVHFALCHIYGGSTSVPDSMEISELASLADMLGLEGLKEVVTLALKMKYCHFFHKPCSACTTSVSECLLIATSFGLDELQEKCLKWITKHMMKAWPTKAFAALPDEILQKCYNSAKMEIAADTVLDTLLRCDKLMATLPHVKWTEPVFSLTSRLAETASAYLSAHFPSVLSSHSFLALRSGQSWSIHALETTFLLAIDRLPLDCACQAYVRLHGLLNAASHVDVLESADINENFDALLSKIHRQVELFLIHNANRIVRCSSWSLLTPDLQKKIKDAAVIVFEFGKPTAPPPQLSSLNRKFTRTRASNSTSSASPTIERARISSSVASLHVALKGVSAAPGGQKKAPLRDGGSGTKAATLPRAKEAARKSVPQGSQQGAISESAEAASKNHHHTGSHTLPLTKTTEIRKKASESGLGRRQSASSQLTRNVQSCKSASSDSSSTGHARPKSWPVRDRPLTTTASKSKDKTPVRDSPREVRPGTTGRATLRSTARQSTLTNGNSKPTTPTAPRPKSAVYISGAGHSGRPACNGSVRDSKASNLRKAASSDLHGKENIDEIRPRSSTRPRSEEVSSPAGKRAGLRQVSARTSRLTTSSKS